MDKVEKKKYNQETEKGADVSWFLLFMTGNFLAWAGISIYLAYYTIESKWHSKLRYDRKWADQYYLYFSFSFIIGAIFAFMGIASGKTMAKKSLAICMMIIQFVVASTWFIQYLRITPSFIAPYNKYFMTDTSRYLEWSHDQAALFGLVYVVCGASGDVSWPIINSYIFTIWGFLGCILPDPFSELCWTLAFWVFIHHYMVLEKLFDKAIKGESQPIIDVGSLKRLRTIYLVGYWGITIVAYLQKMNLISYAAGEMWIGFSEMYIKIGICLTIVNALSEQSQNESMTAIESFASSLEQQMAHSDNLLEKMIPPGLIEQLKAGKATGAEEFESVTVFFSDIPNFDDVAEHCSVKDTLASLNNLWVQYDVIAKKHGIYKVETIGDAFLGVVGAPDKISDHALRAANFAVDIIKMAKVFTAMNGANLQIRIGLNSGPITAGILGDANPHWCIVGDTVNTASRMESTSKPNHIHISESTYNMIKNCGFDITGPDVMNVKGKGVMNTFWINGRKN